MSRRGDNGIHLVQLLGLSYDGKTCYKMRKGRGTTITERHCDLLIPWINIFITRRGGWEGLNFEA